MTGNKRRSCTQTNLSQNIQSNMLCIVCIVNFIYVFPNVVIMLSLYGAFMLPSKSTWICFFICFRCHHTFVMSVWRRSNCPVRGAPSWLPVWEQVRHTWGTEPPLFFETSFFLSLRLSLSPSVLSRLIWNINDSGCFTSAWNFQSRALRPIRRRWSVFFLLLSLGALENVAILLFQPLPSLPSPTARRGGSWRGL